MGLADFLASVEGSGSRGFGHALGGETDRERIAREFQEKQLPVLTEQLRQATDPNDVRKAAGAILTGAFQAGAGPNTLKRLQDSIVGPALQGMQQHQMDALVKPYISQPGKPAIEAQPRPAGTEGPLTQQGNFIDPQAAVPATPGKPFDQDFVANAIRTGLVRPQDFKEAVTLPGQLAKTQATEDTIKGLPSTAPEGQVSQQAMARLYPQGMTSYNPNRELSQGQLDVAGQKNQLATDKLGQDLNIGLQKLGLQQQQIDINRQRADQVGANQGADKPLSDKDLKQLYEKAIVDREKMRHPLMDVVMGHTEGYNAADANIKSLEAEMQKRGLLPSAPTQPTPPTAPTAPTAPTMPSRGKPTRGQAQAAQGAPKRLKFDAKGNPVQ